MGLISSSKALPFQLCGVEDRPSDSTASRSHRAAWRVTPRSIRKQSCVRPSSLGAECRGTAAIGHACFGGQTRQVWNQAVRRSVAHTCADHFSDEPSSSVPSPSKLSSPSSSSTCRMRQRGLRECWNLIDRLNFRCMPDKCRPTTLRSCKGEPNG